MNIEEENQVWENQYIHKLNINAIIEGYEEQNKKCYICNKTLTRGNRSATRYNGQLLCRKCAKFP